MTDTRPSLEDFPLEDAMGPDLPALSEEDREWAEEIVDALESVPTVSEGDLEDRAAEKHPRLSSFDDEPGYGGYVKREHQLPRLELPGFGSTRDDPPCGTDLPHVCTDCGETLEVGRTCAQSRCPRCAPAWVMDRVPGHVSKIQSAAKMKSAASGDGTPIYKHHVVLSPPKGILVDSEDPLDTMFKTAVKGFFDAVDADGHAYYHPWQGDTDDHEDDRGKWKHRLFNGRSWEGDVLEELQPNPHFHLVIACPWVPGGDVVDYVHKKTGWVIKRITERNGSPVSLGDMESVARAGSYSISHVGLERRESGWYAAMRAYGSAYHSADDRHDAEAEDAVREAAPETLGIPDWTLECRNTVPEEEADTERDGPDPDEGEGEGADPETPDDAEPDMATCYGSLELVGSAEETIEDPEWQRAALYAEEALEALRRWREAGGWRGLLEEDPPPD